ncbi:VOC family protein [Pseudonocardia sp. Cha107L01]|jgi:catechol 2,3-dioxygenase-like lactoylglutathione lyase family enzyme|uniref:VOC family protein n=1 Tax=Pseudonocardia sp. Cha107L01 TaxID=3457576 RepID=UPI00403EB310
MTTALTPTALKTGHVGLNVTDLTRSKDFYQRVLGLELMVDGRDGDREWAFLGRDGTLLITLWRQSEGLFATALPGLHHLAFQVDTPEEVLAVQRNLSDLGADFHYDGVVAHREGGDSGGVFFTDPDGIRLEVYTPSGLAGKDAAPVGEAPTCGFF